MLGYFHRQDLTEVSSAVRRWSGCRVRKKRCSDVGHRKSDRSYAHGRHARREGFIRRIVLQRSASPAQLTRRRMDGLTHQDAETMGDSRPRKAAVTFPTGWVAGIRGIRGMETKRIPALVTDGEGCGGVGVCPVEEVRMSYTQPVCIRYADAVCPDDGCLPALVVILKDIL